MSNILISKDKIGESFGTHFLKSSLGRLPEEFELEVCYRKPEEAERFSYYPGVKKISDNTLTFKSQNYFEVLRTFNFIN